MSTDKDAFLFCHDLHFGLSCKRGDSLPQAYLHPENLNDELFHTLSGVNANFLHP